MVQNIVPRIHNTKSIGRESKWWYKGWFSQVHALSLTNQIHTVTTDHLWQATYNVLWTEGIVNVAAGDTAVIDTIPLYDAKTVKWLLRLNSGTKYRSSEFCAHVGQGSSIQDTEYSILGDRVDTTKLVEVDNDYLYLKITNNTASTLAVKYRRIGV